MGRSGRRTLRHLANFTLVFPNLFISSPRESVSEVLRCGPSGTMKPLAWPSQVRLSGDNPAASPSPSPSHLQETRSQAIGRKNYQPGFSLILTYPAIILVLCKNTTCFSCGVLRSCYSNLNFSHLGTTSAFLASSAYHLYYNQ